MDMKPPTIEEAAPIIKSFLRLLDSGQGIAEDHIASREWLERYEEANAARLACQPFMPADKSRSGHKPDAELDVTIRLSDAAKAHARDEDDPEKWDGLVDAAREYLDTGRPVGQNPRECGKQMGPAGFGGTFLACARPPGHDGGCAVQPTDEDRGMTPVPVEAAVPDQPDAQTLVGYRLSSSCGDLYVEHIDHLAKTLRTVEWVDDIEGAKRAVARDMASDTREPAPDVDHALAIASAALTFGRVNRATMHPDGAPETVATHTVMLAMLVAELAAAEGLDVGLAVQMAVVHDLPETYCGDTCTARALSPEERVAKDAREAESLGRLRDELGQCWSTAMIDAYEAQEAPEARLVKYVDKIMPKLVHVLDGGRSLASIGMSAAETEQQHTAQGEKLHAMAPGLTATRALFDSACARAVEARRRGDTSTPPATATPSRKTPAPKGEPETLDCPECGSGEVDNLGDGETAVCLACKHEWDSAICDGCGKAKPLDRVRFGDDAITCYDCQDALSAPKGEEGLPEDRSDPHEAFTVDPEEGNGWVARLWAPDGRDTFRSYADASDATHAFVDAIIARARGATQEPYRWSEADEVALRLAAEFLQRDFQDDLNLGLSAKLLTLADVVQGKRLDVASKEPTSEDDRDAIRAAARVVARSDHADREAKAEAETKHSWLLSVEAVEVLVEAFDGSSTWPTRALAALHEAMMEAK